MKKLNRKTLIRKLDGIYSKYIRFKDAKKGYVKCCSCGKIEPPEDMDCGHFISRSHFSTRYDERNTHSQCRACNRFHEGRKDEYALFLQNKYGNNILQELNQAKWTLKKHNELELQAMIDQYQEKLEKLSRD